MDVAEEPTVMFEIMPTDVVDPGSRGLVQARALGTRNTGESRVMNELLVAGEAVPASIAEEGIKLTHLACKLDDAILEPYLVRQLVESRGVVSQLASPIE